MSKPRGLIQPADASGRGIFPTSSPPPPRFYSRVPREKHVSRASARETNQDVTDDTVERLLRRVLRSRCCFRDTPTERLSHLSLDCTNASPITRDTRRQYRRTRLCLSVLLFFFLFFFFLLLSSL